MNQKVINLIITIVYFAKVRNTEIGSVYFRLTASHRILVSQNTVDLYSKTLTKCSVLCANNHQCCMASFDEVNSTCRLDYSGNCCIQMEPGDGLTVIKRKTDVCKYIKTQVLSLCNIILPFDS